VEGSHPDAHTNPVCLSASSAHRTPDRQSLTSKRVSWPLRYDKEDHHATPAPPCQLCCAYNAYVNTPHEAFKMSEGDLGCVSL